MMASEDGVVWSGASEGSQLGRLEGYTATRHLGHERGGAVMLPGRIGGGPREDGCDAALAVEFSDGDRDFLTPRVHAERYDEMDRGRHAPTQRFAIAPVTAKQ